MELVFDNVYRIQPTEVTPIGVPGFRRIPSASCARAGLILTRCGLRNGVTMRPVVRVQGPNPVTNWPTIACRLSCPLGITRTAPGSSAGSRRERREIANPAEFSAEASSEGLFFSKPST